MKKTNVGCLIVGVILLVCFLWTIDVSSGIEGASQIIFIRILDFPSLFCIIGITLIILAASGKTGGFFKALSKGTKIADDATRHECVVAVNCAIAGVIISSLIGAAIYGICLSVFSEDLESFIFKFFLIFIPLLYGFIFTAVLIPIKCKFE